jgi:L-galactose dehydrogenase/L-glyceraldehyde 3-phosphate reductase
MRRVIDAGLVRFAGLTGLGDAAAVRRVIASGSFATVQSYVNALNPSAGFPGATGNGQDFAGLIRDAAAAGMGVIAIRVLAAGALSGTDQRAENAGNPGGTPLAAGGEFERDVARAHRLAGLASGLGLDSTVELGLRFVLSVPGVSTALAGVSNLDQLNDAVRWAERGPLTHEAADRVVEAAR